MENNEHTTDEVRVEDEFFHYHVKKACRIHLFYSIVIVLIILGFVFEIAVIFSSTLVTALGFNVKVITLSTVAVIIVLGILSTILNKRMKKYTRS